MILILCFYLIFYKRNPSPGKIINRPNGTDVYEGVVIDYKGTVR